MDWLGGTAAPADGTAAPAAQVRAAQPDLFGKSRADIQAHGSSVTTKRAHKFMSDWRSKTTATAEMEKDLTDGAVFDWVGYLKSHRA